MKRPCAVGLLGAAAFLWTAPSPSHAAWCANYTIGGTNCGFSSFQTCQAAVSGVGGICTQTGDRAEPSESAKPRQSRAPSKPSKPKAAPKQAAPAKQPAAPSAPSEPPAAVAPPAQPPQVATGFERARLLVLNGQYEAGIKALRALQFDDHPDVAAFVGFANRKLGRVSDARSWYDRALTADPNHKLAISFSGMLRAETGDLANARVDLERLRQICGGGCNEYEALAGVITAAPK